MNSNRHTSILVGPRNPKVRPFHADIQNAYTQSTVSSSQYPMSTQPYAPQILPAANIPINTRTTQHSLPVTDPTLMKQQNVLATNRISNRWQMLSPSNVLLAQQNKEQTSSPSSIPSTNANTSSKAQLTDSTEKPTNKKLKFSIILVCIIIVALLVMGGIGGGIYALVRAMSGSSTSVLAAATISLNWETDGTTIAGNATSSGTGADQLNAPYSLVMDSSGAFYVSDSANNRIQKFPSYMSAGTTIAGQGNGVAGTNQTDLSSPGGMEIDSNGGLYIADSSNQRIQYWSSGATSGSTVAGTTGSSGSTNNLFNGPRCVTRNPSTGDLYISDSSNHRVMQYSPGATSGTVVAGGNGAGNNNNQLNNPRGLYYESSSNSLIIANYGGSNVVRWVIGATTWTNIAGVAGSPGNTASLLDQPFGVTVDSMSNIYVADMNNHRIQLFMSGRTSGRTIAGIASTSGSTASLLNMPQWVLLDRDYHLYVADTGNNRIQLYRRV